jgi:hypothetical protein
MALAAIRTVTPRMWSAGSFSPPRSPETISYVPSNAVDSGASTSLAS